MIYEDKILTNFLNQDDEEKEEWEEMPEEEIPEDEESFE